MSDLRPTLFLAQLPNLLAGNISLVHGVVGSSRTFMGEEAAGVDAVRVAQARIAAGQSELTLVGGAYNGARWDVLLDLRARPACCCKDKFAPVWDRGPNGGIALATMGAFLVLESRGTCAGARRATAGAAFRRSIPTAICARARRDRGGAAPAMGDDRRQGRPRPRRPSFPAPAGLSRRPSAERGVLKEIGLPVRNTGTYIGHGVETQFLANLGIACAALEHGKLFAPAGSGDTGDSPPGLSQVIVTSVGNWRGEGLALVERVD